MGWPESRMIGRVGRWPAAKYVLRWCTRLYPTPSGGGSFHAAAAAERSQAFHTPFRPVWVISQGVEGVGPLRRAGAVMAAAVQPRKG